MSLPIPPRRPATYCPEWGSEAISYVHQPELVEYYRTFTPHGLVSQGIWVVANVMDAQGRKYNLMRQYKAFETLITLSSQEVPGLTSTPLPVFKPGEMFIGRCSQEIDGDKGLIEIKPYLANPKAFSVSVQPQHVRWQDADGRVDLEFSALGPALEYYVPGLWEDDLYRSEPCRVTGTLNGEPVSGMGTLDAAWGPAGCDFTQSKIYRILEEYWLIWMNFYDDGTADSGIYVAGPDRFQVGYYNQNGQAAVTRCNSLQVERNETGFPTAATLRMDDWTFQFTAESRVAQVASYVSWASGRVLNRADKRTPVQSFAWFEFFPKRA